MYDSMLRLDTKEYMQWEMPISSQQMEQLHELFMVLPGHIQMYDENQNMTEYHYEKGVKVDSDE
jgi:hypothetical protein